jgi:ubiquinone/menaquinone biosynthesis C-methylase UbiE
VQRVDDDPWETYASWWQEHFTDGADPEYVEQILPLAVARLEGARRILEVGTGEGQVARAVAGAAREPGRFVVGIDRSSMQITEAARRGGDAHFGRAAAGALPFAAASVDAVVACLVFEHIDDVDDAIAEVARVLEPGGRFVLFLNHPLLQTPGSGWIDDQILDPPEQYWRVGPYLDEAVTLEQVTKGVFIRFVHRPLSRYVNSMVAHRLLVEHLDEPSPPPGFLALAPEYAEAASIPRLLVITARRYD